MTDVIALLRGATTVVLVDWPSRDVPDTLARSGFSVVSNDGPEEYNVYEVEGEQVRHRTVRAFPQRADLMYTHRPIDELPEIVDTAISLGAKAVWVQSGRDGSGAKDPRGCRMSAEESRRARAIVEAAGLEYVQEPYIADAVRGLRART